MRKSTLLSLSLLGLLATLGGCAAVSDQSIPTNITAEAGLSDESESATSQPSIRRHRLVFERGYFPLPEPVGECSNLAIDTPIQITVDFLSADAKVGIRTFTLAFNQKQLKKNGGSGLVMMSVQNDGKHSPPTCKKIDRYTIDLRRLGSGIGLRLELGRNGLPTVIDTAHFGVVTDTTIRDPITYKPPRELVANQQTEPAPRRRLFCI